MAIPAKDWLAALGARAALDGDPCLVPGGERQHLLRAGDSRDTALLRGTGTRAGSSGESRGATLTCTSSTIVGFILLLSPATLKVWLPALCKTLEIPINCCY